MYIESLTQRLKFIVNELSPIDRLITVLYLFLTTLQLFRYVRCFRTSSRLTVACGRKWNITTVFASCQVLFLQFCKSTIFVFPKSAIKPVILSAAKNLSPSQSRFFAALRMTGRCESSIPRRELLCEIY